MRAWPSSIEIPTVPGGLPGQASSVTQKNTIPTANRPRTPPTTIASLILPDISFPPTDAISSGRTDKKTPGGMPAGGLLIPGFFTRGRQA